MRGSRRSQSPEEVKSGGSHEELRGKTHAKRQIAHDGTEGLSDVFKKQ